MKPLSKFRAVLLAADLLFIPGLIAPAYAQTEQTASLLEALSMVSGRMLVSPPLAPEVTHDGDRFHVHIPLPKLTTPPDAAIEVAATPLSSGVWDITSVAFPPTGTVVTPATPPVSLAYAIGQQTAHARIDPTLAVPSPYAMAFSDIALHVESAAPPANLTIRQVTFDGTITGDADQRMTTRSRGRADDWHLTAASKTGAPFSMSLKSANMRYDLDGLDRAKAERLRDAARMTTADEPVAPMVPGQMRPMSPAVRQQLRAMVEASAGLLRGFDAEDTLRGLHFEAAGGVNGDIGEIKLAIASHSADDRVAGHYNISLNDMTLGSAVPARFAQYAPRRFLISTAFAGIPAEASRQLLRQATEEGANPMLFALQATALLNEPGARAGIEALLIEAGPLLLEGSGRIRPAPDGSVAFDMHLSARGLDEMLALVQADPNVQQAMPMLFMAKGMGKQEGDRVVWDIAFADGAVTVNGVPMGGGGPHSGGPQSGVQRPGGRPDGVRPPVSR